MYRTTGDRFWKAAGILLGLATLGLASGCGSLNKVQQAVVDAADDRSRRFSTELAYAGFGLHWPEEETESGVDDPDDFRNAFAKRFGQEMDRRVPKALRGDRPVKLLVTVSDVHTPGALARGLAFQNPSIRITAVVQDDSEEQPLHTKEMKVVDVLPPDFSSTFRFRIGTIPDRLAREAVNDLMDWLRSL